MLRGLPSIIIVWQKLSERWARLEKKTITNRIKQNIFMEAKLKKIQPQKKKNCETDRQYGFKTAFK